MVPEEENDGLLDAERHQARHTIAPRAQLFPVAEKFVSVNGEGPAAGGGGPAVVGEDAAALLVQLQLPCQRHYARRGTTRSQHDGHPLGGGSVQRCPGGGGNDLLVVGQGAVEVERQHTDLFLFHFLPHLSGTGRNAPPCRCFWSYIVYCTTDAASCARLWPRFLRNSRFV